MRWQEHRADRVNVLALTLHCPSSSFARTESGAQIVIMRKITVKNQIE